MQEREKIKQLFDRYQRGQCTAEEKADLHAWFNHYAEREAHGLDEIARLYQEDAQEQDNEVINPAPKLRRILPYVAAAILIVAMIAILIFNLSRHKPGREALMAKLEKNDVMPGGNRAKLTLADGTVIDLDRDQNGIMVSANKINYPDGNGNIVQLDDNVVSQLALSTPKGGTYQLMLADGTKVWLNAGSTLRYPSQFAKNERVVEIIGEAYFSVVKDKTRPFRVISRGQQVEVMGTEFNISAYNNDREIKTTLVSGAVRLKTKDKLLLLSPGEQAACSEKGDIHKQPIDVQPFVAWKNGEFYFENTPLTEMLKQLSRWYDIDVVYAREIPPNERFSGTMSRNVTLQTVLKLLKISEIGYRIENNKLIIE